MPVYDARARRAPGEPFRPSLEMSFRGHRQGIYGLDLQPGRALRGRTDTHDMAEEQEDEVEPGRDHRRPRTRLRDMSGGGVVSLHGPPKVLSAGGDGSVMLWDANPTTRFLRFRGHHGPVYGCAFGPNSSSSSSSALVASCGHDGYVRLWVSPTRRPYASSLAMHSMEEVCNGVAVGSMGHVSPRASASGRGRREADGAVWKAHTGASRALCFAQDGSDYVYTVGDDKGVKCWDTHSGCATPSSTLLLRPSHSSHASGYYDKDGENGFLWGGAHDKQHGEAAGVMRSGSGGGGRFLGSFGSAMAHTGHTNWLRCLAVPHATHASMCAHYLASGGDDQTVHVWDTRTRTAVHVFYEPTASVRAVSFHPDAYSFACADAAGVINLFDLRRSSQEVHRGARHRYSSPLQQGRHDGASARYGALLQHYRDAHVGAVNALSFAPNGGWLLSAGEDGAVRLWDVKEGFLYCSVQAHEAPVRACCFSSDGDYFATAGMDKVVMLWRSGLPRTAPPHALTTRAGTNAVVRMPSATYTSSVRFALHDMDDNHADGERSNSNDDKQHALPVKRESVCHAVAKENADRSLPPVSRGSVSRRAATLMTNPTSCSYQTIAISLGSDGNHSVVDDGMCSSDPFPQDAHVMCEEETAHVINGMSGAEAHTAAATAAVHGPASPGHSDAAVSELRVDAVGAGDASVIPCDEHTLAAPPAHADSEGDLSARLMCLERAVTNLTELVREQQSSHAAELAAVQSATKAEQVQHKRDIADLRDMMRTLVQQQTILAQYFTTRNGMGE